MGICSSKRRNGITDKHCCPSMGLAGTRSVFNKGRGRKNSTNNESFKSFPTSWRFTPAICGVEALLKVTHDNGAVESIHFGHREEIDSIERSEYGIEEQIYDEVEDAVLISDTHSLPSRIIVSPQILPYTQLSGGFACTEGQQKAAENSLLRKPKPPTPPPKPRRVGFQSSSSEINMEIFRR